jgi:hypothetical protein
LIKSKLLKKELSEEKDLDLGSKLALGILLKKR